MLSVSLELFLGDSVVIDSELSFVFGIMFDQYDKLIERMEIVEVIVGRYLGIYFGNLRIFGVSVQVGKMEIIKFFRFLMVIKEMY